MNTAAMTPLAACPYCSATVEADSVFCTNCGSRIASAEESYGSAGSAAPACVNCGNTLEADALFCTNCGSPVASGAGAAMETSRCETCGASLEADSVFCVHCGAKVGGAAPAQEPPLEQQPVFTPAPVVPEVSPSAERAAEAPAPAPRFFEANDGDSEAESAMKAFFHAPGSLG